MHIAPATGDLCPTSPTYLTSSYRAPQCPMCFPCVSTQPLTWRMLKVGFFNPTPIQLKSRHWSCWKKHIISQWTSIGWEGGCQQMTASCALQLLSPFDNALLAHDPMVTDGSCTRTNQLISSALLLRMCTMSISRSCRPHCVLPDWPARAHAPHSQLTWFNLFLG